MMAQNEGNSPFRTASRDARMALPERPIRFRQFIAGLPLQILRRII
jgi:hypothetical protein